MDWRQIEKEFDECHTRGGIVEWPITGSITLTSLLYCSSVKLSQSNVSAQTVASLTVFVETTNLVLVAATQVGTQSSQHIYQFTTCIDEPQQGRNSCLWLYHLLFGMTGEAITGSQSIGQSYCSPACLTLLQYSRLVQDNYQYQPFNFPLECNTRQVPSHSRQLQLVYLVGSGGLECIPARLYLPG